MATDEALVTLMRRHEAFWRRQGEAPLRSVTPHRPLAARGGIPLADGTRAAEGMRVFPAMLDPARFWEDAGLPALIQGDFMAGPAPPGMCWTEAAFGCPVRIVTGGPWAEAFVDDWRQDPPPCPEALWIDKLEEFVAFLAGRVAGGRPVAQPLLRGPVDMMFAALGHEEACLAVKTAPERADDYLAACTDLFISMAQRRLDRTPPFQGGYLSSYGIWAPGTVVRTQVDNVAMLSPNTYRERILPFDRRVFEAFDVSLIHLHSCCLHIVDVLVEEEALDCIQVSIDYPGGPLAGAVMPRLQRILEAKPLIVTGPVYRSELQRLERLEPAGGLCLQVQLVPDDGGIL